MNRAATRSRVASALDGLRVLGPLQSARQRLRALQAAGAPVQGPDGLPLPPARLRVRVTDGDADADRFLAVGRESARLIRRAVQEAGGKLEGSTVLDFGCGCGKVARHWRELPDSEIHGCDLDPESIDWCRRNLPFVSSVQNGLEPPTPYEGGSFDVVYALSVLTHLPEPLQLSWVEEFRRLLRPGGLLLFTTLGELWKDRLPRSERERFELGLLVVERPRHAGGNLCTAYHPQAYVEETLLRGFEHVISYDPRYLPGAGALQDLHVARAPAGS